MKVISRGNVTIFAVASVAHYSVVLLLSRLIMHGYPGHELFVAQSSMLLWVLLQPANLVTTSGFGQTLSPFWYWLIFIANSLLWGGMAVLILAGIRRRSE